MPQMIFASRFYLDPAGMAGMQPMMGMGGMQQMQPMMGMGAIQPMQAMTGMGAMQPMQPMMGMGAMQPVSGMGAMQPMQPMQPMTGMGAMQPMQPMMGMGAMQPMTGIYDSFVNAQPQLPAPLPQPPAASTDADPGNLQLIKALTDEVARLKAMLEEKRATEAAQGYTHP